MYAYVRYRSERRYRWYSGYVAQGAFEGGKKSRRGIDEDETKDRRCDREAVRFGLGDGL